LERAARCLGDSPATRREFSRKKRTQRHGWLFASNGYDCGLSDAKRMRSVGALEDDTNRKSLVKADPVQSLLDIWQAGDGCAVLLKQPPSYSLHLSPEALGRIAHQRYVCGHSRAYAIEQVFPEISEHVPITIIHNRQHRLTDIRVLTFGNVEISDVAVE